MIKAYRFWTREGVFVVLRPENKDQSERVIDMGQIWIKNRLHSCRVEHLISFAEQNRIPASYFLTIHEQ